MSPENLKPAEGLNPHEQIAAELAIDQESANYVASVQVKCPVKGPNGEVLEMTFGDFMGTEHGQEHGAETLLLAKRKLESGVDLKEAISDALGSQAIRDRETGDILTADSRSPVVDTQESKKK